MASLLVKLPAVLSCPGFAEINQKGHGSISRGAAIPPAMTSKPDLEQSLANMPK